MRNTTHKTVEAVLKDIVNGLFAGEVENLIRGPPYETTIQGKELLLERAGERFMVTVKVIK